MSDKVHFLDMLSSIDHWTKHTDDPAAVVININVEECYSQMERGRPLRPSSIRWIKETFNSMLQELI